MAEDKTNGHQEIQRIIVKGPEASTEKKAVLSHPSNWKFLDHLPRMPAGRVVWSDKGDPPCVLIDKEDWDQLRKEIQSLKAAYKKAYDRQKSFKVTVNKKRKKATE